MTDSPFDARSRADENALVDANPMAWIIPRTPGNGFAEFAPFLAQRSDGETVSLLGHLPRRSPIVKAAIDADGADALAIFTGPHAYISPSWMSDPSQAPSWNYTAVQYSGLLEVIDDDALLKDHLTALCDHTEQGRENAWSTRLMGERFDRLARHVVPLRLTIRETRSRFKLGQDERDDIYTQIMAGLRTHGRADMAEIMAAFNNERDES